jgi:3-hydroxypropanoate dehydrogenase
MSGLEAFKLNAEFFANSRWQANTICTLGYRREDSRFPRNRRLDIDVASQII